MSDKEIKKAHVEEIELEIPMEEYIAPEEIKEIRRKKSSGVTKPRSSKSLFEETMLAIKETAKVGVEVIKGYKDEILTKRNEEDLPVKPNAALLNYEEEMTMEEEISQESGIEIEFAKDQKPEPKIPYKMHSTPQEQKIEEQEKKSTQQQRPKKKKVSKNRPSASPSARAESFIELFETEEDKKPLMSDKDFRKFIGIATVLLVLFGLVWYGFTYITVEDMSKVNTVSASDYPGPIKPSELFTTRTPEVFGKLGNPRASGSIDGTENSFFEYEDVWFGSEATTKIVYGVDKRVYSLDIAFKSATMEKIYTEMVKYLGEPISNNVEIKEATWFVDSSMYILAEEEGKATLNIQTPIYDNVNAYPIAVGAMIIQKQSAHDLTGDGKNDVVVIIGEKESYIYSEFTKLHMTIWDGENVFYTGFPTDTDGGANPKITYEDIDKNGVIDVSIETRNNAINNYNSFTVTNGAISSIYASHEKSE